MYIYKQCLRDVWKIRNPKIKYAQILGLFVIHQMYTQTNWCIINKIDVIKLQCTCKSCDIKTVKYYK